MDNLDNWKKIGIGAGCVVGGIVAGLGAVTLVGNLVDGDEYFIIRGRNTDEVVFIKSERGGLFSHAHELFALGDLDTSPDSSPAKAFYTKYTELVEFAKKNDELQFPFVILNALYHDHVGVYNVNDKGKIELVYKLDYALQPKTNNDGETGISESGGGHTHGLEVVKETKTDNHIFGIDQSTAPDTEKKTTNPSVDIIRDGNGILAPEAKDQRATQYLSCAED